MTERTGSCAVRPATELCRQIFIQVKGEVVQGLRGGPVAPAARHETAALARGGRSGVDRLQERHVTRIGGCLFRRQMVGHRSALNASTNHHDAFHLLVCPCRGGGEGRCEVVVIRPEGEEIDDEGQQSEPQRCRKPTMEHSQLGEPSTSLYSMWSVLTSLSSLSTIQGGREVANLLGCRTRSVPRRKGGSLKKDL